MAEALKRVQRERAVVQGLSLITWTFDPLEAPNAHLNLHKLRAISRSYWRDIYGSNFGELNAGLPTDRLVAEWWLLGSRVTSCIEMLPLEIEAAIPIFVAAGRAPDRQIVQVRLELEAEFLQLEIPADIHPVKAANMALALAWRLQVRQALENYLAKGYIITDFISAVDQGERQNRYILQRSGPGLLAEIGLAE